MSMKDDILKIITTKGPKTDSELATLLGQKQPSIRRARNELCRAEKLAPLGRVRTHEAKYALAPEKKDTPSTVTPIAPKTKAAKKATLIDDPPTPAEKKDWRATDFTF